MLFHREGQLGGAAINKESIGRNWGTGFSLAVSYWLRCCLAMRKFSFLLLGSQVITVFLLETPRYHLFLLGQQLTWSCRAESAPYGLLTPVNMRFLLFNFHNL